MTNEEKDRLARLEKIREAGIDPYPTKASKTHTIKGFHESFESLVDSKDKIELVGRIRLLRKHGGLTFLQLQDESGIVQLVLKKDAIGEEPYNQFHELIDVGDFLSASGSTFVTKKEENSLLVEGYSIV